jgi:hypothetical protein
VPGQAESATGVRLAGSNGDNQTVVLGSCGGDIERMSVDILREFVPPRR